MHTNNDKDTARELIEKYIELIDTQHFKDFYINVLAEVPDNRSAIIGCISEILESVEIFPLLHLEYIPKYYAAYRQDLEKVVIPAHIAAIDPGAFKFCSHVNEVVLPEGLEILGHQAFAACTALEKINFPNSLLKIDTEVFFNCSSLDNYKFNDGLKQICMRAFWGTKQDTIEIPSSITQLASDAFGTKKMNFIVHRGAPLLPAYASGKMTYID